VAFALLLVANVLVAVRHLGTRAGQTDRSVCRESGAVLSYSPAVFGGARLAPGRADRGGGRRWELVEPRPPSLLLPWNWRAVLLERPAPDPEAVFRQAKPGADSTEAAAEPGAAADRGPRR
jgi:hypothetical protein